MSLNPLDVLIVSEDDVCKVLGQFKPLKVCIECAVKRKENFFFLHKKDPLFHIISCFLLLSLLLIIFNIQMDFKHFLCVVFTCLVKSLIR